MTIQNDEALHKMNKIIYLIGDIKDTCNILRNQAASRFTSSEFESLVGVIKAALGVAIDDIVSLESELFYNGARGAKNEHDDQ